ncbi:hypothetical protein NP233_g12142 [Leucocoprinus birnbaumii]|uniref:G domain-containing protein n=1 Tax=Leucocoprinus birnbaumii TaxID=56174 RepID=A0AAD5VFI3_9AGAR|nr:hypothetical protein NP233_g12142 [Leucocoprinus birnbaumii]
MSIREVACRHPHKDYEIRFVDTPGFDPTSHENLEVLNDIARWLAQKYQGGVKLSGVIYTHRITDNRVSNSALTTLDLFQKICGADAFPNIRLVTTHWDDVRGDTHEYEKRETELCNVFWSPLIERGSKTLRFHNNTTSAWDIIDTLPLDQRTLQIQQEMVDQNLSLEETTAGRTFAWFWDVVNSLRSIMERIGLALRGTRMSEDGSTSLRRFES